jgi:hypothetical protein
VDGEPGTRLVNYPLAGHDPELAADRIAVILTKGRGRIVIVDESLSVRDAYRVHGD